MYQVEVKYLQIDFSDEEQIYVKIEKFLEGYDIGVLVNNVGIGHPLSNFMEIPNLSKQIKNLTRVNITSIFKVDPKNIYLFIYLFIPPYHTQVDVVCPCVMLRLGKKTNKCFKTN